MPSNRIECGNNMSEILTACYKSFKESHKKELCELYRTGGEDNAITWNTDKLIAWANENFENEINKGKARNPTKQQQKLLELSRIGKLTLVGYNIAFVIGRLMIVQEWFEISTEGGTKEIMYLRYSMLR